MTLEGGVTSLIVIFNIADVIISAFVLIFLAIECIDVAQVHSRLFFLFHRSPRSLIGEDVRVALHNPVNVGAFQRSTQSFVGRRCTRLPEIRGRDVKSRASPETKEPRVQSGGLQSL